METAMPSTLALIVLLAGTATHKPAATPEPTPVYQSSLPAGSSDMVRLQDQALHEAAGEFIDRRKWRRSPLHIVSDSGHFDSDLALPSGAKRVHAQVAALTKLPAEKVDELAAALLAAHGATWSDNGTFKDLVDQVDRVPPSSIGFADLDTRELPHDSGLTKPMWLDLSAVGMSADGAWAVVESQLCFTFFVQRDLWLFHKDTDGWHMIEDLPLLRT
jgi:hypothetical protein